MLSLSQLLDKGVCLAPILSPGERTLTFDVASLCLELLFQAIAANLLHGWNHHPHSAAVRTWQFAGKNKNVSCMKMLLCDSHCYLSFWYSFQNITIPIHVSPSLQAFMGVERWMSRLSSSGVACTIGWSNGRLIAYSRINDLKHTQSLTVETPMPCT